VAGIFKGIGNIAGGIDGFVADIENVFGLAWTRVMGNLSHLLKGNIDLSSFLNTFLDTYRVMVSQLVDRVGAIFGAADLSKTLSTFFHNLETAAKDGFTRLATSNVIGDAVKGFFDSFTGQLGKVWKGLGGVLKGIFGPASQEIEDATSGLGGKTSAPSSGGGLFDTFVSGLRNGVG